MSDRRENPSPGNASLLLIDYNHDRRRLLTAGLHDAGFQVTGAADWHEGFEEYRCSSHFIQCVLLAVDRPTENGLATLAKLQTINSEVVCCFLIDDPHDLSLGDLVSGGATNLFVKPLSNLPALVKRIADLSVNTEATLRVSNNNKQPLAAPGSIVYIYPPGPDLGARFVLGDQPAILGRGSDCDIVVNHLSISRHHARISKTDHGYLVRDLGSTNGTFLNHVRITESELCDGDHLGCGECLFRYISGNNIEAVYHDEIHRMSLIDPLTGAANRRYLMETLRRELSRAQRYQRSLGLILLDIDHFKHVNDTFGHLVGDHALRIVVQIIRGQLRREDHLGRYGGEEFAVVLPETDHNAAVQCAERLRQAIAAAPFQIEQHSIPVTVSLGVTSDHAPTIDCVEFLRRADELLYEAKGKGRNRVAS